MGRLRYNLAQAWQTVLAACLIATMLAGIAAVWRGPTYTATAVIRPELRGPEASASGVSPLQLDALTLLASQIELMKSQPVPQRIVDSLYGGALLTGVNEPPRAKTGGFGWLGRASANPGELAAADFRDRLDVKYLPRSYLVQVAFSGATPERAAALANAVADEFIRGERLRKARERRTAAERELNVLQATYGELHPRLLRARSEHADAAAAFAGEQNARGLMSPNELAATGSIIPASATQVKPGPGVLASMAFGFAAGLVLVILAFMARDMAHDMAGGLRRR